MATEIEWNLVDLSWNASTDNVALAAYDIYRDGGHLTSVSAASTSYADTSVNAETSYRYEVRARDETAGVANLAGVAEHLPDRFAGGAVVGMDAKPNLGPTDAEFDQVLRCQDDFRDLASQPI